MKVSERFRVPQPPPWGNTAASLTVVASPARPKADPCGDCLAMCCWFVLVETGTLEDVEDLDVVSAHLDYERLVVWIQPSGEYTIGIISPCRHLDRGTCGCTVYGTADRPGICKDFDASLCWYRAHFEPNDAFEWVRLDGRGWPAYRATVDIDDQGRIQVLPRARDLDLRRRRYEVSALLHFDIPEDAVEERDRLAELLFFLSNFEGVELARTPEAWHLLYPNRRDREIEPHPMEVRDGCIDEHPAEAVFRPTRRQLHELFQRHGPTLWDLGPEDLRV